MQDPQAQFPSPLQRLSQKGSKSPRVEEPKSRENPHRTPNHGQKRFFQSFFRLLDSSTLRPFDSLTLFPQPASAGFPEGRPALRVVRPVLQGWYPARNEKSPFLNGLHATGFSQPVRPPRPRPRGLCAPAARGSGLVYGTTSGCGGIRPRRADPLSQSTLLQIRSANRGFSALFARSDGARFRAVLRRSFGFIYRPGRFSPRRPARRSSLPRRWLRSGRTAGGGRCRCWCSARWRRYLAQRSTPCASTRDRRQVQSARRPLRGERTFTSRRASTIRARRRARTSASRGDHASIGPSAVGTTCTAPSRSFPNQFIGA